jgi:hypothetical protein
MPKVVWILRNFVWNEKRPPHGSPLLKIMSKKQKKDFQIYIN